MTTIERRTALLVDLDHGHPTPLSRRPGGPWARPSCRWHLRRDDIAHACRRRGGARVASSALDVAGICCVAGLAAPGGEVEGLEAELARAVEAARAANPDLVIDPRRFVTYVAEESTATAPITSSASSTGPNRTAPAGAGSPSWQYEYRGAADRPATRLQRGRARLRRELLEETVEVEVRVGSALNLSVLEPVDVAEANLHRASRRLKRACGGVKDSPVGAASDALSDDVVSEHDEAPHLAGRVREDAEPVLPRDR